MRAIASRSIQTADNANSSAFETVGAVLQDAQILATNKTGLGKRVESDQKWQNIELFSDVVASSGEGRKNEGINSLP